MSDPDLDSDYVKKFMVSRSTGEAVGVAYVRVEDSNLDLEDLVWSDDSKEKSFLVEPVVGGEPTVHILNLPPELRNKVHNAIISSFTQEFPH